MKIEVIKIVLFCLIPLGIALLIMSLKSLKMRFFGTILLEFPYHQKINEFIIKESGFYAIWHKAEVLKRNSAVKFKPVITNIHSGEKPKLYYSILRPKVNGFNNGRMELFHFHATKGEYEISLKEGSSALKIEAFIAYLTPVKDIDLNKYSLQVRKSQSNFETLLWVILTVISGFLIIGGFVSGILAEQLFT